MITKKKNSAYMVVPACAMILMSFGIHQNGEPKIDGVTQNSIAQIPDSAPVDFSRVTKVVLFGDIVDPGTRQVRKHTGIDFQISAGSNVVATADGVVVVSRYGEKRGNYVVVKHDDRFSTQYFHLNTALVKEGEKIMKGHVIGLVGNTGLSTIPHLHYEVLKDDTRVDPKDYLPALPD
ncbi:MAG TPA: M23 family metallopeptidase [Chryseosolibacter sp.]|nr:M23 family metallopeptidase [Chryseosolibacter sp.]